MEGIVEKAKIVQKETDVPVGVKNTLEYEGSHIQTDQVKIVDPGIGQGVVLRHFFYKAKPVFKDEKPVTKQDIFNENVKLIEINLWGDGLVIQDERRPEIHTRASAKKASKALYDAMVLNKADFVILVLAKPRRGQWFNERPKVI